MVLIETATGRKRKAIIAEVQEEDINLLTKKRFSFDWKSLTGKAILYKLKLVSEADILGVMALIDVPSEMRMEVKLLASSKENVGTDKLYDGICGNLLVYACRQARSKYGHLACVSLLPKTVLKSHYIKKYKMVDAGWHLYLEGESMNNLLRSY